MSTFTTGYTNLGSLGPTSFPPECLESLWDFHTSIRDDIYFYLSQGCAASSCCPSSNVYTESYAYMTSYYSPGVCPSQYRACSPPSPPTTLLSNPGETIAFCCPTNYDCPQNSALGTNAPYFLFCQSPAIFMTTTYFDVDNVFDQKTTAIGTTSDTFYPGGVFVLALPIQIRMPATQSATQTPFISFSTSTSTSSVAPVTMTASSSTALNPSLSGGAIAGIAVGAFLGGAFILAGVGFFLYRLIMRRLNSIDRGLRASHADVALKPELDGQGSVLRSTPIPMPELEGSYRGA
jgi:hypothetical protein